MPLREFSDHDGKRWRVWDTMPASTQLPEHYESGWLTFEHDIASLGGDATTALRRRLTPIPSGWSALDEDDLRKLCEDAAPEKPRRRSQD